MGNQLLKKIKGFTIIEAITATLVVAILAASGAWIFSFLIRNSIFLPNQLNTDMIAADTIRMIAEGDEQAMGLHFSKAICRCDSDDIVYLDQNDNYVRIWVDGNNLKIYRSIDNGADALIPYYISDGISLHGFSGTDYEGSTQSLFEYFHVDRDTGVVDTPATCSEIDWITINVVARVGSGSIAELLAKSVQSTSVTSPRWCLDCLATLCADSPYP